MTEIYLDTANLNEIKEVLEWNIISGVTTNQKIFLKEKGCNFEERSKAILDLVHPFPVSLEGPNDYDGIIKFAEETDSWKDDHDINYSNVVIKVPMLSNGSGLRVIKTLYDKHIRTNLTACMTLNQVFLASCTDATYVSLFYNRMKDWKGDNYAKQTVINSMNILRQSQGKTKLIIGSIRNVDDIQELLTLGPDIITIPYKILTAMPFCIKTVETLEEFENAWRDFNEKANGNI